jgi:ribosomal protein S18 acetylase RimI-like enzyme
MNANLPLTRISPTSTEVDFLEDRLYEHNCQATGKEDGQLFGFLVRDEQGAIVAGLSGWTWAGACEIRTLWVDAACRGQGYGRRLIAAAEDEARAHACRIVLLTTYSFQAPEFYRKLGYETAGRVDGFPPGHQHHILLKRLEE